MRRRVLIVGAGIFGRVIGATLLRSGHDVTLIDSGSKFSGYRAAGCIVRPSWLTALGNDGNLAIKHLKAIFKTEDRLFYAGQNGQGAHATIIPIEEMANCGKIVTGSAKALSKNAVRYGDAEHVDNYFACDWTIIAAGIWTPQLIPDVQLTGLYGTSVVFRNAANYAAGIVTYAPYKQAVWFPRADGFWFGDGQALIKKSYTNAAAAQTLRRGAAYGLSQNVQVNTGIRPYAPEKTGILRFLPDNVIVSTGGAKNGSAVAALHALEIERRINAS